MERSLLLRLIAVLIGTWLSLSSAATRAQTSQPALLIHGMTWQMDRDDATWGTCLADTKGAKTRWTGMIGYLASQGWTYGGTIHAAHGRLDLPESFDNQGASAAAGPGPRGKSI